MTVTSRPTDLGARILGAVGVALLLAAAVSVVSARWQLFGPGARLTALLVASAALLVLTRQLRRLAPSTTQMLDVLVAAMVPIDTAAAVIVTGGSWRAALVVAGPVAALVGAARRNDPPRGTGDLAIAAGGVLAAMGVAAEFDRHGPLLLAGLAVAAAVLATKARDRRIAAAWALLSGLAPAGRVFDEAVFTGMGTLREIGLLDPASLPTVLGVGALATLSLVVVALRDRSRWAAVAAAATTLATGLEVWAITDPPSHVGVLAVAVLIALVELVDLRRLPVSAAIVDDVERLNEAGLVAMTALVAGGSWMELVGEPGIMSETPVTAGVVAAAWILGQLGRGRTVWPPALPGVIVAGASAPFLASGDPRILGLGLLVGSAFAIVVARPGSTATALVAAIGAPLVVFAADDDIAIAATAWAAIVVMTAALRRAPAPSESLIAATLIGLLGHGVVGVAAGTLAWHAGVGVGVVALLWWGSGVLVHPVQSASGFVLRAVALIGPLILVPRHSGAAVVVAAGLSIVAAWELSRARRGGNTVLVQAHGALLVGALAGAWLAVLRGLGVDLLDLYAIPLVWVGTVGAVVLGAPRTPAHLVGLALSALVAIGGRVEDGLAAHTAVLGVVAVVVAVAAGRAGDRLTLVVAGPAAVAAATFDVLDRSVGVESWGWLLVGGAAAISAAVVLERRDADSVAESSVG